MLIHKEIDIYFFFYLWFKLNLAVGKINITIEQFRQGNALVYKKIFDEYYPAIRSFAYSFIQDDNINEDIVQDAFMKLWERREQFTTLEVIKSYLYTIVKNDSLNYIRQEQIHDKHKDRIKVIEEPQFFVDHVLEEEVHFQIHKAIKDLSAQSKKVIGMSMTGYSNPEIAQKLNISVNTVKTIKKRAYSTLRKKLKGVYWILFFMMTQG